VAQKCQCSPFKGLKNHRFLAINILRVGRSNPNFNCRLAYWVPKYFVEIRPLCPLYFWLCHLYGVKLGFFSKIAELWVDFKKCSPCECP
jgi:hypothetical protein